LEYQTKTVQEILNQISSALEEDAVEYTKQAQRVAEWDVVLRDSHSNLETLTESVAKLLFQQQEVDRTLNGVDAFQKQLSTTLDGLETQIDELFQSQAHLIPQEFDMERETAFQTSLDVDARLVGLQQSLNTLLQDMNASTERTMEDESPQLLQVLNHHHETLLWLETTCHSLQADLNVVSKAFSAQ